MIPFRMEALITLGKDVFSRFEKKEITTMFYLIIVRNILILTLTGVMLRFCTLKVVRGKGSLWRCYI